MDPGTDDVLRLTVNIAATLPAAVNACEISTNLDLDLNWAKIGQGESLLPAHTYTVCDEYRRRTESTITFKQCQEYRGESRVSLTAPESEAANARQGASPAPVRLALGEQG